MAFNACTTEFSGMVNFDLICHLGSCVYTYIVIIQEQRMHVSLSYEAYHLKIPNVFCYNQVCGKVFGRKRGCPR